MRVRLVRRPLIVLGAVCAFGLVAAPALADVLVNAPPSSIPCGQSIKTGVWYQSFSGGPRTAKIQIKSLAGTVLKSRAVIATTTWKYFHDKLPCGRTYRVHYVVPGGTSNFTVKVRA